MLGEHISPAVMLKVAGKLSRYAGDLARAVRDTQKEFGCASFVAGTPVWGEHGLLAIQQLRIGNSVLSRDDRRWSDHPQAVTQRFTRIAPGYREIVTEFETYRLTDEHPVWCRAKAGPKPKT